MDEILNYENKDQDLYELLGCSPMSSTEQIQAEYRVRARAAHPDKNPDSPDAVQKFQRLQFARDTLCDPGRRALYDKWRTSGLAMSFSQWMGMREAVHTSMHWATPRTSGRMLPEASASGGATAAAPAPSTREAGAVRWGTPQDMRWSPAEGSDLVRKFRNYEI